MSFWDYVLPWKAIPNMAKDVKDAWGGEGKNRHDSFVGAIGKYADPVGALLGDNWMDFWHGTVPREVNRALKPVGEFHRDYLDPIYMAGGKDTELGRAITDQGVNKGGDWSALITGAILGGGALAGAGGGGSGGGGSGGSSMTSQLWKQGLGQAGSMLQQAGQQQPMQQAAPGIQPQQRNTSDPMEALKLLMEETPNAGSLDELAERLARYGAPPSFGNPQATAQPAVQVNVAPPPAQVAQRPPPPGTMPHIPQTRGEAQTNVSLGQALGGYYG